MNTRPRLARLATDALARERVGASDGAPDRPAEIDAVGDAIVRAHTRRLRRRWILGVATAVAAAAVLVLATAVARRMPAREKAALLETTPFARAHGIGSLTRAGEERPLREGEPILAGDRVAAREGEASVTLATGTELEIEAGAEMDFVEQTSSQVYALRTGVLRARVAKLQAGQRFLVRTADAEIEVRGTAFSVRWAAESVCGTRTRLVVTEGTVAVRAHGAEDLVPAGHAWPACETPAPEPQRERPAPTAVSSRGAVVTVPAPNGNSSGSTALAAENALFGEAVAARRRGDSRAAVAAYEQLLRLHATSPLAEDASAERMRLLAGLGDSRALEAASSYLARFPNGFARDEAREILAKRR
jgi:ferric-dicitrate binding protein FerR (iron transport regulator)